MVILGKSIRKRQGFKCLPSLVVIAIGHQGITNNCQQMMNEWQSKSPTPNSDKWLEIGTIVAPQGLEGELRVYPTTDFPERFEQPGVRWLRCGNAAEPQVVELLQGRYLRGKGLYVVKLAGIDNRNQAEALRQCKLLVPESDRPTLSEQEYHVSDLIGLEVVNQTTAETIGVVVNLFSAGNDLLEVKLHQPPSEKVLIPFVKAIVPVINLEAGCLEIVPPPGLLEVNQ